MIESLSPAELIRHHFFVEEIEGQQFIVNRNTGHIGILNESASIMIDLFLADLAENEVVHTLAGASLAQVKDVQADVRSLISLLQSQSRDAHKDNTFRQPKPAPLPASPAGQVLRYKLNSVVFSITYPSKDMLERVNAALSTMAVDYDPGDAEHCRIFISKCRQGYELFVDHEYFARVPQERDVHGFLRGILIRKAYDDVRQLIILHAACVSKSGKAVILAAPSGAGKSTLALSLARRGYGYLGDDTIGVDLEHSLALPFPTMAGIKAGNLPIFAESAPGLRSTGVSGGCNKPTKTIKPPSASLVTAGSVPIRAMVFIRYLDGCEPALRPVNLEETLMHLNHSGVVFHPEDVSNSPRHLLLWLKNTPCFQMIHRDTESASNLLKEMFWCD